MEVLFVCKGNYFRSQIAATIYNKLTGTHDAISAGTYVGAPEEPEGQSLIDLFPREYFDAMLAHGLDMEANVTKKLTPEMLKRADIVVSMAEEPHIPNFLRADKRVIWWNVPNPDVATPYLRETIYRQIYNNVQSLIKLSRMNRFIEFFGWYGAIAILTAYALVSFEILLPSNLLYQLLNGTGALGIVAISLNKKAYQPAALNAIWAVIAVIAILRLITG